MASDQRTAAASRRLLVIGNFDGVHLGHQAVLGEAVYEADARGLRPTVLTFDPHPAAVLGRPTRPMLTTSQQKKELLRQLEPSLEVVILEFDHHLAALTPEQFARRILKERLNAKVVVVGQNFRFGRGRAGDLQVLERLGKELGFVARAEPLRGDESGPFSSTRIRQALEAGDVAGAARLLGRPHLVFGRVERGDQRGRTLGFPTANLEEIPVAIPAEGVYFGWAHSSGLESKEAVVNIGTRPTVGRPSAVEVHLLDYEGDLYGQELSVELLGRLRPVQRFADVQQLKLQIGKDIDRARELMASGVSIS